MQILAQHRFISRPHGLTAPVIASTRSIRLPEKFRALARFRDTADPRRAAGGNSDPLPAELQRRRASGAAFERTKAVLPDSAKGQTALPQSSSRMPSCRAIFGSHSAASEPGCGRHGRSSREGFSETCLIAGAGRATRKLPERPLPRHALARRTKVHTGAADCETDQNTLRPHVRYPRAPPTAPPQRWLGRAVD